MTLVLSVLEQGMIYAIMALGIYITYTILDFPDLTVDGSFPLGAAISAVLITKGVNPILTLLISFLAGVAAGTLTGLIHVKLKVRDLLSGIIMMTALYTVNLRIAGRANVPIYNMTTLFDNALVKKIFTGSLAPFANTIIILVITLISIQTSATLFCWYVIVFIYQQFIFSVNVCKEFFDISTFSLLQCTIIVVSLKKINLILQVVWSVVLWGGGKKTHVWIYSCIRTNLLYQFIK